MRSELVRCSFRTITRMLLTQEPLTDEDLDDVVEFVRVSNPFAQQTWGWDTGRFVDWRWGSNSRTEAAKPGWFEEHGRVFCSGSEIVAVAIAEYGGDDVCIITQGPNAAVIDWVLAALTDRRSDGGAGLRFEVAHTAEWLRPIFGRFGLVETTRTGTEWEYDLATVPPAADLAPGFVIEALAVERSDDYAAIADCINRAFDREHDIRPALESLEANPFFRPELSVFARSPGGRIAAYCRGTVDPLNGVCGIDPVCTDPDFRQMGLARAVVGACFRTQRDLGGRLCYIGSAPEPAPSTKLYRSLGPLNISVSSTWSRP